MKSLNILALATLCAFSASHSMNSKALGTAAITWATVSPVASYLVNYIPNPLWLLDNLPGQRPGNIIIRYAWGLMIGGSIGTLAAVKVYNYLNSKPKNK